MISTTKSLFRQKEMNKTDFHKRTCLLWILKSTNKSWRLDYQLTALVLMNHKLLREKISPHETWNLGVL